MFVLLILIVHGQVNNQSYKWGTYKPQLIHAITERNMHTFNPLTATFYYFLNKEVSWEKSIKYRVNERSFDDIIYNYQLHDGEKYAIHETIDPEYKLHFTNEFFKINVQTEDWVTTVVNNEAFDADSEDVSLIYSIALEKLNPEKADLRKLSIEEEGQCLKVTITTTQSINFIYISLISNNKKTSLPGNARFRYQLLYQNPILNYNLRTLLHQQLRKNKNQEEIPFMLENHSEDQGNVIFVQYVAKRNEQFKFQLRYTQKELAISQDTFFDYRILKKLDTMAFNSNFQRVFGTHANSFYNSCGRSAFINLMGGFVTSYGNIECDEPDQICHDNRMMLTPTPSRAGFPRPFLWDDGFHNLLVCRWKPTLCFQSLLDWFDTMSESGWIPREQARSSEQKAAVPMEFLPQKKSETNPPTFMFNIMYLNKNADMQPQIKALWPKIYQWYSFWIKSQGSRDTVTLFKWWGRNENVNFGSGMDDWPRSSNGVNSKYNIDASLWAWYFSESMAQLAIQYAPDQEDQLRQTADAIKKAIFSIHLDKDGIFKDVLQDGSFSSHLGYPNLLAIAFGFATEDQLDAYVSLMRDNLWSNHGLRSLSFDDPHFGKGDNYWTGPIWVHINYLVLKGIHLNYLHHEGLKQLYKELRENIINTVCLNWRDSGYFFEHYNQKQDGEGRGYYPFTGWTATINLIINESYD